MTATTTEHLNVARECVERGAEFLDKHFPNWFWEVDLVTLDMSTPCHCVAGQLYEVVMPISYRDETSGPFLESMEYYTSLIPKEEHQKLLEVLYGDSLAENMKYRDEADGLYLDEFAILFGFNILLDIGIDAPRYAKHTYDDLHTAWCEQVQFRRRKPDLDDTCKPKEV